MLTQSMTTQTMPGIVIDASCFLQLLPRGDIKVWGLWTAMLTYTTTPQRCCFVAKQGYEKVEIITKSHHKLYFTVVLILLYSQLQLNLW